MMSVREFGDDDQSANTTDIHDWKEAVVTFTAGTNATKVELREVGVDQNNGRGMRIDDIRVYGKAAPVNAVQRVSALSAQSLKLLKTLIRQQVPLLVS